MPQATDEMLANTDVAFATVGTPTGLCAAGRRDNRADRGTGGKVVGRRIAALDCCDPMSGDSCGSTNELGSGPGRTGLAGPATAEESKADAGIYAPRQEVGDLDRAPNRYGG